MDPQQQYGVAQSEQWPREAAPFGWAAPQSELPAGGSSAAAVARRARTGVIVLVALLTEIVVFAATANQSVYDKIVRGIDPHTQGGRLALLSWQTYLWRLTPSHGHTALWGSQLALLGVVLVVSGLLVAAVVRGPITFGRAFFGTWTAVVFATQLGAVVRGLIDPAAKAQMPGVSPLTRAVFGDVGPSSRSVLAAFVLGVVVALLTALAAVASRRSTAPAADAVDAGYADAGYAAAAGPYVPAEAPPPYYGSPYGAGHDAPAWQEPRYPAPAADDTQATTQLPSARVDEGNDAQATTQLPSVRSAEPPGPDVDQPTAQFPQPPDDEEIGQDPHHDHP